ncbi:hypothetical protein GCM10020358_62780 [Amorphoplanes nipponensis]|uniref:Uncharacterized protein n=1 Tax=Actinoplanes nipponensis TaxID=135950 RepID=A0A919JLS8_9ACTN|nr:hypothetical protein Ani05nite_55470 [Actinoplanes nipponensis]
MAKSISVAVGASDTIRSGRSANVTEPAVAGKAALLAPATGLSSPVPPPEPPPHPASNNPPAAITAVNTRLILVLLSAEAAVLRRPEQEPGPRGAPPRER